MNAKIEGSTENLPTTPERHFGIGGLEDVPRSIIPVPFYRLVQPSSDKVILPDGKRAANGLFLMQDIRKTTPRLRFIILRAKRQTREQKNDYGQLEKIVSLNVLGINLERGKPFILSVPVTSFSAFGRLFEDLENLKVKNAWEYPVIATTAEKIETKSTPRGVKKVNYWVIKLEVQKKKLTDKQQAVAKECYDDFAAKLDRNDDEDDLAAIAGKK